MFYWNSLQAPPSVSDPQQRHSAEEVFLSFRKSKLPYNVCRYLFGELAYKSMFAIGHYTQIRSDLKACDVMPIIGWYTYQFGQRFSDLHYGQNMISFSQQFHYKLHSFFFQNTVRIIMSCSKQPPQWRNVLCVSGVCSVGKT